MAADKTAADTQQGLKDYCSDEKLKKMRSSADAPNHPSILTRYYTLFSLLPDLNDKIVLDLPCGLGHAARKFVTENGVKKVIAVEIVEKQIELSREADSAAGIKPDRIEYVLHDAKHPKILTDSLVDICVSLHLLCFAENYAELVRMCQCIYLNLKPGGVCFGLICSLAKDTQLSRQFGDFNAKILHLDPWDGDAVKPRRLTYIDNVNDQGFEHSVHLWEFNTVYKALQEAGFTRVALHPYQRDPSYQGELDLTLYTSILDGKVIVATK